MRLLTFSLLLVVLAGCGNTQRSADTSGNTPSAQATTASAPREIAELTDQKLVYECPKCGMTFDAAGKCSMDQADLVETQVAYLCPMDEQPVEHAGRCPRCPQNAKVVKTAVAAAVAPEAGESGR